MNNAEKKTLEGGLFQLHLVNVIEPWYIRKDTGNENISMAGKINPIMANTFVEYYY